MPANLNDIEPGKQYSIREIAELIPSAARGSKGVTRATVYRWIAEHGLPCQRRTVGQATYLFVWGRDVLEFLGAVELPVIKTRSKKQLDRDLEIAREEARKLGILE